MSGPPGHQASVRLRRKSVGMREECQGQRPGAHPPRLTVGAGSRRRCEEKQERVHSVEAKGRLGRVWAAVAKALKAQAG